MVHFASTTVLGLIILALGASGAPADKKTSDIVITYDDIKNAEPVVPDVTDPTKKALAGDSQDNSTILKARPDLADVVKEAEKTIPKLLADKGIPKKGGKSPRDLEKRADEECEIFSNNGAPRPQAAPAALALAAQKSCKIWFPTTATYFVPENSSRKATWFNHLILEYNVRHTTCTPYQDPIKEYYATSQAICIAQFAKLFALSETLCAGDYSGVTAKNDKKVPIWYSWKTY